jgi:hypothetical protein
MTLVIKTLFGSIVFFAISASAQAGPTASSSVFATGGPVGGSQLDSVTIGDGSVWIEYGNTAHSTGTGGSSTIVQCSYGRTVQHTYTISGLVDGLKFNPVTGMVWALQNNDANAKLSIINPTTQTVSGPLRYGPPYTYTTPGPLARGYDDVAFLGGKVYLSYTNPASPTDPTRAALPQHDRGAAVSRFVVPHIVSGGQREIDGAQADDEDGHEAHESIKTGPLARGNFSPK